ncbi:MAG: AEC family transporter, partial [Hydrogenoanaerobacterium sp.]
QGAFRGNVILLGLPLAISMYGSSGTGTTSVIMAYSIPLYNILGVAILAIFYDGKENKKINWGNILLKIVKNPLVIATLAALPFALTGVRLPALPTTVIQNVGGIASAFGLMLLGAQMRISSIHKNKAPIAAAVVLKLVVFPLAVLSLAVLFGFTKIEIGSLFILTAAPMSVSSFIMANNMGGEGELAGQMVVISTICSMLTMLVGLYILKLFGVI